MTLNGYYLEDIEIGMTDGFARTITEADIVLFCGISGDTNPVHLNEDYAKGTMFKGRIAHGMLTAALVSTVLGTKLPGPGAIYVSQNLKFLAPVRAGYTVKATVTVREINAERKRVTLDTVCTVGETKVVDGEAVIMVPRRPA